MRVKKSDDSLRDYGHHQVEQHITSMAGTRRLTETLADNFTNMGKEMGI